MPSFTHDARRELALDLLGAILLHYAAASAQAKGQIPPDRELIAQIEQIQAEIRDAMRDVLCLIDADNADAVEAVIARFGPLARKLADRSA